MDEDYQNQLANHIIKQGYTIYGGYVYKKLVNGDETNDIDVHVKNIKDMDTLADNLNETFGCHKGDLSYNGTFWDINPYINGRKMLCPFEEKYYKIELMIESTQNNDIFKLEYKQDNNKPQIVYKNGTDEQAKKVIKELKQKRFTPWENMRDKDKRYFSKNNKWTDTSTFTFKIKKYIGLVE